MKWKWINDGEPDDNGDIAIVIENDEGHRISTFKGKSKDEVIVGLANSQVQANRRLGELLKPDKAQPPADPPISDADRLRLSSGVTDPSRVVETVTEITEKKQRSKAAEDAYYRGEAEAFVEMTPEYYPTPGNQAVLFRMLEERGYDLTRNNLGIVFREALRNNMVDPWPGDDEEEAVAVAPNGRERGSTAVAELPSAPVSRATGLRNSDASASRPAPPKKKPIITRVELEKMTRAEYTERLRDPAFRRAVDELG
jgi:hypothetical protein